MKKLHLISILFVFFGGINWGLIGFLNINLVELFLGKYYLGEKIIYVLFGLSTLYIMASHIEICKICSKIKIK